jgi:M6 family metalloprotease-like protein
MRKIAKISRFFTGILAVTVLWLLFAFHASAAPLYFEPVKKILPNGTSIDLFVSGDEFFNWVHDKSGYPVGTGSDGYYYYLLQKGDDFTITGFRAGTTDPRLIPGIKTVTVPSYVAAKRARFQKEMDEKSALHGVRSLSKSTGQFNNLVIYIRFLNESAFSVPRSAYETNLNGLTGITMRNYYREISYNKLDIISYHLPGDATTNLYYTDTNPRNYYQPYTSSNTNGYKNDSERAFREHSLLANAIYYVTTTYSLPAGVNFDVNGDGVFDNICFVVKGNADGWSDLLWPHRWVLYTQNVKIGALSVYGYTLQLENVAVTTFSHEMFHALGAPDLYHYNNNDVPVGPWDIMANGKGHPGAWMKYKYGGWIGTLPEIKKSGTYSIKSVTHENNCMYILKTPFRNDQFFVFEYRNKSGTYELNLPQSGLLIYRIDQRYAGNANGSPDEIYVYRLNGSHEFGGDINSAAFSDGYSRTSFSDNTNPGCFLQDGTAGGIIVKNIIIRGDSATFTIDMDEPVGLKIFPEEDTRMNLSWYYPWDNDFLVAESMTPETFTPQQGVRYLPGDTIGATGKIIQNGSGKLLIETGLISDEQYYYTIWTITSKDPVTWSHPVKADARTGIYSISTFPFRESFDNGSATLPRGWKSSEGSEGWAYYNNRPFSEPNSLLVKPGQTTDGWFYTPGFMLSTYQKYMITFRYRNLNPLVKGSLRLKGGSTRQNIALNGINLISLNDFRYEDWIIGKAVFKPGFAGANYFGFTAVTGGSGILIDDFRFEKVPEKTTVHSLPEEYYPNPSSGRIIVPATERTEISIYGSDGIKLFETVIESMQELDLSSIGKGLFLIRFKSDNSVSSGRLVIL